MLTHIFMQADRDPTIMIGGFLPLLGAGHRVGKGDTIILESCEYCNSFLNFSRPSQSFSTWTPTIWTSSRIFWTWSSRSANLPPSSRLTV